jgi:hypothetical protein
MYEEMINARLTELRVADKTISQRMMWEQVSRIDRLERALKMARVKLQFLPTLSAKAH